MFNTLRSILNKKCSMKNTQCSMHNEKYSMKNAQCSILNEKCSMLNVQYFTHQILIHIFSIDKDRCFFGAFNFEAHFFVQ